MISVYENCLSPKVYGNIQEDEAFDFIRRNNKADKVRKMYRTDRYSREKIKLPGWTPAGQFSPTRAIDNLEQPSGYVYFDLDNYTDKKKIAEIPEVKAVWYSLSGNGLGGLFTANVNKNNYSSTYEAFGKKYDLPLDRTSDISRFNILSYDTDIIVKDSPSLFTTVEPKIIDTFLTEGVINNAHYESCRLAYSATIKKGMSFIIGQRDNFCSVYFTMTNIFGIDISYALEYLIKEKEISLYSDFDIYQKAQSIYARLIHKFNTVKRDDLLRN